MGNREVWTSDTAVRMFEASTGAEWSRVGDTRPLLVMADNDPVWCSPKVELAKERLGIQSVRIPPRSPDIYLMGWAVFPELRRRSLSACRETAVRGVGE